MKMFTSLSKEGFAMIERIAGKCFCKKIWEIVIFRESRLDLAAF
jgi:hypothetical protein